MFKEFMAFISKGNVMDLAVGVIIAGAFGKIVTALTDDLIMPIVSLVFKGADFSSRFIMLSPPPASYTGSLTDFAALKKGGAVMLGWGDMITVVINFIIIAFVVFLLVKLANKVMKQAEEAPAEPSAEVLLLTEIRDSLKK